MNKLGILLCGCICLVSAGCFYDSQELLYGLPQNVPCDTTNITYSGRIEKIINLHCGSCHSSTTGQLYGRGIVLDTYEGFQKEAKDGKLLANIKQGPGSNPMPKDGTKLSPCDINIIQQWLEKGSPDN